MVPSCSSVPSVARPRRASARSRGAPRARCGSSPPDRCYASGMRTLSMLALTAALAACSSSKPSKQVSADEAKNLLIDRNWLDTYPQTERDKLHVYRFVPNMGGGVFQDRTLFKGVFELFSFS